MIVGGLLAAGACFRRMIALRNLLLAVCAGLAAGLAVRGLPAPSLAQPVFVALVATFTGLLVIPLAASLPAGDRACGFEQLVGLRPIPSLALGLGRAVGCVVGAAVMALLLAVVARTVAAGRDVPRVLAGRLVTRSGDVSEWRFSLPKDVQGSFDLRLEVQVPLRSAAALLVDLRRGESHRRLEQAVRPGRSVTLPLPDLSPSRGDLYVRLGPRDGLVIDPAAPELVVGVMPLGEAGLALPRAWLARLGLAVLAAVAAACAFHFETALLAGLLALLAPSPAHAATSLASVVVLLLFAVLGTALVRRQALP